MRKQSGRSFALLLPSSLLQVVYMVGFDVFIDDMVHLDLVLQVFIDDMVHLDLVLQVFIDDMVHLDLVLQV
ncbi:hypothetical protein HRI_000715400 [Hibiscus trionum]|uniref:Uncharacterized protein n=1 Tax=Hibiscus trionum TaxID=183268 RepID=A0A9W7LNM1_HIBTR|nr:hypothetical protein HRI_000715400 [Hibiscus trionum]